MTVEEPSGAPVVRVVPEVVLRGRELAVYRLLVETNLTFGQIAAQEFVSENTIKSQAREVYRKLGVHRRRDLPGRVVCDRCGQTIRGGGSGRVGEGVGEGR